MICPNEFAIRLEERIQPLPDAFYSSFEFTKRGNNLTHPVTIGMITEILIEAFPDSIVAHDIRFNEAGRKFQPDIVVLSDDFSPELYVDYESPNSSDSRIPDKDVQAYSFWIEDYHDQLPYYIVTTLPSGNSPGWKLIHTGKDQYNSRYAGPGRKSTTATIRRDPRGFWYSYYQDRLNRGYPKSITFFNIDHKIVEIIEI